jgi:hypothetical protein
VNVNLKRSLSTLQLLAKGWILHGSPAVTPHIHESEAGIDDEHTDYIQALVKGTPDEFYRILRPMG